MNIAQLFDEQVDSRSDATAISDFVGGQSRKTGFGRMQDLSRQLAAGFRSAGLKKGDRVMVFQPMSLELYVCLLALFRIGCAAMFLDPSAGRKHIDRCCKILSPDAVVATPKAHLLRITSKQLRKVPQFFSTGIRLPFTSSLPFVVASTVENADVHGDDAALITFTSGSTGLPKAAIRTHGFLINQLEALSKSITFVAGETVLETMPIFGLANLASGMTTLIPDVNLIAPGHIDPEPVVAQIQKERPERLVASPAFLEKLLSACDQPDPRLDSLRKVFTGGGPVFPALLKKAGLSCRNAEVTAVYGSTEAEPIAHIPLDEIDEDDFEKMASGAGLLTGPVEPELDLRIMRNSWGTPLSELSESGFNDSCLAPGEAGEIVVSGPHVLNGYYQGRGDDETKFRVDGQIWHRTGDSGTLDKKGRLWLLGRCNAVIPLPDRILYPFAIETAAMQNPMVVRAALCRSGSEVVLCVELEDSPAKDKVITKFCKTIIEKVNRVEVVDKIPLDSRHNAKVDYTRLEKTISK
ncbi:MAG TPA: AMP-binding protein [Geopsychrobacteraceae bacterium]|nr:AMP-binding protein [Geopsychrobacteraceae bacterium]